jgi:hypothetical protein
MRVNATARDQAQDFGGGAWRQTRVLRPGLSHCLSIQRRSRLDSAGTCRIKLAGAFAAPVPTERRDCDLVHLGYEAVRESSWESRTAETPREMLQIGRLPRVELVRHPS